MSTKNKKTAKCFTYRGAFGGISDPGKEPFSDLQEFEDSVGFLSEYLRMDPTPFRADPVSVVSINLETRRTICSNCPHSTENFISLDADDEMCIYEDEFPLIWGIALTQNQKRGIASDGTYPSETTTTPIKIKDIRLNGKPCQLIVERKRYKGRDFSIPLDLITNIQPGKKETLATRLIAAINEYLISYGAKHTYLAEGYGISVSSVKKILAGSAAHQKQKSFEIQDSSFLSQEPHKYVRSATFHYTTNFNRTNLMGIVNLETDRLINLVDKKSLQLSLSNFRKYLKSSESVLSADPELINNICELTRTYLSIGKNTGNTPAELVHLAVLLWREVLSGLAQLRYKYSLEDLQACKAYLDSLLAPMLCKIFLHEKNDESSTVASNLIFVAGKVWEMDMLQNTPSFKTLYNSIWRFSWQYQELEQHYKKPLRKWNQIVSPTRSPSLEEKEVPAKEILDLICAKAAPTLSANDVIFHVLYFNEAIIEPSMGPDPFYFTPIGNVITEIDQPGIPLQCLSHLLDGGLLSENPSDHPTCSLYRDEHFDPDLGPCKDCPRQR